MLNMPLAFEVTSQIFSAIRKNVVGGIAGSTSLALSVACTIVAFQLIKLSYDIMSDEQQGGFGGVRLWQVLRPVIIVLAINLSPTLFGWFDGAVNFFCSSVNSPYSNAAAVKILDAQLTAAKKSLESGHSDETKEALGIAYGAEDAGKQAAEAYEQTVKEVKQGKMGFFPMLFSKIRYAGSIAAIDPNMADLTMADKIKKAVKNAELKRAEKAVSEGLTNEQREKLDADAADAVTEASDPGTSNREIEEKARTMVSQADALGRESSELREFGEGIVKGIKSGSLLLSIAHWLYDLAYFILKAMVEIILCVLTVMFPWTLVLSLFSYFKDAFWKYVATYLNVSFWKVTASIINSAVMISIPSMAIYTAEHLLPGVSDSSYATKLGAIAGNALASAMVLLAGFICMTRVSSITNMIIPNASADAETATSGMGIATSVGVAAQRTVTSAPGKVASVATSGIGKAASGAGKSVTNAMGKVTGGGATP